ncbi:MAG TPA: DUF2878 domain-containing protein [Thermoanaerobaculia bacterium]|nr:DUF2878 domain-containing protein [Thermoanaerobaculia bacterium]
MSGDAVRPPARGRIGAAVILVALQAGWWASVLGVRNGLPWLGPLVIAALLAVHLALVGERWRDLAAILGLGLAGWLADSLLSSLGLITFAGGASGGVAPLWIAGLWLHFGSALGGPLAWLRGRPRLAVALCAVGAPLAYAGGLPLGAVTFHPSTWPTVLALAVEWSLLLPLALAARGGGGMAAASSDAVARPVGAIDQATASERSAS